MKMNAPFLQRDKRMSLRQAVSEFVHDGDTLYVGGFQIGIPVAACFEIVRQGRKNLKAWTVGQDTCLGIDLLVGNGCCDEVHFGWLASWPARKAPQSSRKFLAGEVQLYLYSNYAIMNALMAASMGMPYFPIVSDVGSDLEKHNPNIRKADCPFTGRKMGVVRAPEVDVALIHIQRADALGNGQRWMSRTVGDEWGGLAAKRVILTCEELVSHEVIQHDPDRTLIPFFKTCAVVEEPWGAHPTGMFGYYMRDNAFESFAVENTKDERRYTDFVREWVTGRDGRAQYVDHLVERFGREALERLRIREHIYPVGQIDYGYTDYADLKDIRYD